MIGWFAGSLITGLAKTFLLAKPNVLAKVPKFVLWFLGLQNMLQPEIVNFQDQAHLLDHFARHAKEWGDSFLNANQYLQAANDLLNREGEGIYQFVSSQGWFFKYDSILNEFLLISNNGTISTFFKPIEGMAYWLQQVKLYGG